MDTTQSKLAWMMWLEMNPKAEPVQTLTEAMVYYAQKYGQPVNRVRVPLAWPELNGQTPPGVLIERSCSVLPRHIHLTHDPDRAGEPQPADPEPVTPEAVIEGCDNGHGSN
jgi:hypothetical protein